MNIKEIIKHFRTQAQSKFNPSPDGSREKYYEGRKDAYNDCADILERYSVKYPNGWNNPNWVSVENELPPENGKTQQSISVWATDGLTSGEFRYNFDTKTWTDMFGDPFDITHWIPRPQLPRKED